MGLLEKQLGLLPVTANQQMLAQALKSRSKPAMSLKPVTPQGLLDNAALATSPVPFVGDAIGLAADANRFVNEPDSRTPLNFGLAALGLIPFVPPLVSAGLGKFAQSQGKTLTAPSMTGPGKNQAGAIVYHGSPHKFDQFDSSKIGTGEGAQAYGHGLYFAESPQVARNYQNTLSKYGELRFQDGSKVSVPDLPYNSPEQIAGQIWMNKPNLADAEFALSNFDSKYLGAPKEAVAAELKKLHDKGASLSGSFYKVDLPDEAIAKMLDWDKPLSQQAPEVQKAIAKSRAKLPPNAKDDFGGDWSILYGKDNTGADLLGNLAAIGGRKNYAESLLSELGVPGVRYLDGGSRGAGQGTSNYVVFPGNEGLLKILERQ